MKLLSHLNIAINNLFASRLRTYLAMLGILVGTASVVAMVSSGQLATQQALSQFKNLGTNLFSISLYQSSSHASTTAAAESTAKPTKELFDQMQAAVPGIQYYAPYSPLYLPINYKTINTNGSIIATTPQLQPILKINIQEGRFISFLDNYQFYCVVGNAIAKQFENAKIGTLVGANILVGTHYFKVVGVLKPWPVNSFFDQDINQSLIIPLQVGLLMNKYSQISNVVMALQPNANIKQVETKVKSFIATNLPGEGVFVRSAQQLITSMVKQKQILTIFLGLIGSISLFVGGIGVMNIMLVSVIERKQEIGLRRALGARRRDIQLMFLFEAILLSLIGGGMGVITGVMASYIIARYAHWQFTIFLLPPLAGFVVSALTGIFFGFYPAYNASKLSPIEALKTD